MESHNTYLELGDGRKVLSRGQAVNVSVVTAGYSQKTDLKFCSLLRDVDLVLTITWLVEVDPFIRGSTSTVYFPDSILSFQRIVGE